MTNKKLLLFAAALTSGIVKGNLTSYAGVGPPYEDWIGSSAFSTAAAVVFSSFVMLPQNGDETPIAILYTYYTVMSLLVSVLALKLIWVPVVDLVSEVNTILSKMCLYAHKVLFPKTKHTFIKQVGIFLNTKTAVVWSTNLLGLGFLYLVSTDILNYMGLYFYNLPKHGVLAGVRSTALRFIATMLSILSPRKIVRFRYTPEVRYYSTRSNGFNPRQHYSGDVYYMS